MILKSYSENGYYSLITLLNRHIEGEISKDGLQGAYFDWIVTQLNQNNHNVAVFISELYFNEQEYWGCVAASKDYLLIIKDEPTTPVTPIPLYKATTANCHKLFDINAEEGIQQFFEDTIPLLDVNDSQDVLLQIYNRISWGNQNYYIHLKTSHDLEHIASGQIASRLLITPRVSCYNVIIDTYVIFNTTNSYSARYAGETLVTLSVQTSPDNVQEVTLNKFNQEFKIIKNEYALKSLTELAKKGVIFFNP
jgi:hypothetical protein